MSDHDLIEPTPNMLTYDKYLKVSELLTMQKPLVGEHDETLFIIIHQVYELWFKEILHEVGLATKALDQHNTMMCTRTLRRIHTIQDVMIKQVDVLETMTPVDFNKFRERLNPASGFQSFQFRLLEYALGAKNPGYLKFHRNDQETTALLEQALGSPTLYDKFLQHLHYRGFEIPNGVLERDFSKSYVPCPTVLKSILSIYNNQEKHYDLYLALEAFLDLDQKMLLWRYRHVSMVERMIGNLRGTGGSSGVKYLTATLEKRFFPEIWDVRNSMGAGIAYGKS
jgi:tryptophan 2,3-dioxygenase